MNTNTSKTFLKVLTGVIIILIFAIAVAYLIWINTTFVSISSTSGVATSTSQTSTSTTPISLNWETYTATSSNLTFQAPVDFMISTSSADAKFLKLFIPLAPPYFNTHLIHEAYIKVYAPAATCIQNGDSYTSQATTTFNGNPYLRSVWSGVGAGNLYQGIDYTTTYNGQCQEITLYTHSTNGEGFYTGDPAQIKAVDDQQAQDIAQIFSLSDQIMSTTVFTK